MLKKRPATSEIVSVVAVTIVLWLTHHVHSSAPPPLPQAPLTITRSDGMHFSFRTSVAGTMAQQAQGLMFVRSMPADAGMIFPYNPPRRVTFWMKNTIIPLDMLFIRADNSIGRIVAEARPQDVTPIDSEGDVVAVIELNGGTSKNDGIAVGDKVSSAAIPTQTH